jgi:nucleoside-diphosphate-sugar epimerase
VYSGHGLTWGEIAEIYSRLTGAKIRWCSEEEYTCKHPYIIKNPMWDYDRRFNRDIDSSKILRATGLSKNDFASLEEGIKRELEKIQTAG